MTPARPEWRNPYGEESEEEEPLEWDTNSPYVTTRSLYGSPGLGQTVDEVLAERTARREASKSRRRRSMIKVGIFMGVAAGALFLLASDVLGLKGK
jgi:hypothetical protein